MVNEKALIDALTARVPFRTARRLLVANGFPTGQGWDAINYKLKNGEGGAQISYSGLLVNYIETIFATEKSVRVFKASKSDKADLAHNLSTLMSKHSSSDAARSFPLPMKLKTLDAQATSEPVVAGMVGLPTGQAFVLSSYNEQRSRVRLAPSQVAAGPGITYQEIYAIQVARTQSLDCIYIPANSKKIFALIDEPFGMTGEAVIGSFSRLRSFIKQNFKMDLLGNPINLFPLIRPLYNSKSLRVLAYNHTSTDTSMRLERMRGSSLCLREADFHKGGMTNVAGNTDAFGIEVAWTIPSIGRIPANPELSVLGNYNITYDSKPTITQAHIGKCGTVDEALHVLSSLEDFLDNV